MVGMVSAFFAAFYALPISIPVSVPVVPLAEANRQAKVASQLRAAERGDLIELKGEYLFGPYRWVRANDKGWVSLSSCVADEGAEKIGKLASLVEDVIKQESPKFVDAAKAYLRCEATVP